MRRQVAALDLCEAYIPLVVGGRLDEWTYILPGAFRGREWPCPGRKDVRGVPNLVLVCVCGCHTGAFEHELPPRATRTAVHPTEVLADG